jgi:hypothetical protein
VLIELFPKMPGRVGAADDYYQTIEDELEASNGFFLVPDEINPAEAALVPISFYKGYESFSLQMRHVDALIREQIFYDINKQLSLYALALNEYNGAMALRGVLYMHAAYRNRKNR